MQNNDLLGYQPNLKRHKNCLKRYKCDIFFVLLYGGMQVLDEHMSAGDLFKFVTYTNMLYQYIQWMTSMPRELTGLVESMERINDVMMQEARIRDDANAVAHDIDGEVEFRHASFGYKSYEPVLEDGVLEMAARHELTEL